MSVSFWNEWIFLIHTDNRYVITLYTITKHQHKLVRNTCDRHICICNFGMGTKNNVHTRTHAYIDSSHMFRRAKVLWSIVEDFSVQSTLYSVGEIWLLLLNWILYQINEKNKEEWNEDCASVYRMRMILIILGQYFFFLWGQ